MLQKVHIFVARKNNVVIDTLFDMKKKVGSTTTFLQKREYPGEEVQSVGKQRITGKEKKMPPHWAAEGSADFKCTFNSQGNVLGEM